jgi:predicted Rdx family selenoprotein
MRVLLCIHHLPLLLGSPLNFVIAVAGFTVRTGTTIRTTISYTPAEMDFTRVSTELMLTFPTPTIKAVTVIPLDSEETGGRFRVWLYQPSDDAATPAVKLVWDRKIEGGFPELKELVSSHASAQF